ncbi:hypothetical protein BXY51_007072 [Actinoplanes cyaneus]|nr:hypothetical protein [Actinoplanes cyaneus]
MREMTIPSRVRMMLSVNTATSPGHNATGPTALPTGGAHSVGCRGSAGQIQRLPSHIRDIQESYGISSPTKIG